MLIRIAHDAVHAKVIDADREIKLLISEMLSYQVENTQHMKGVSKGWSGQSSFFNMKKDSFPSGFVRMIKNKLERQGHRVKIINKPLPEPKGKLLKCPQGWVYDERYNYQSETVRRLLRLGGIIAMVATGGGKSVICQLAYHAIQRPSLFLTTRKSLMYQMAEGFEEISGTNTGIIGDGKYDPQHITCATVDTIVSHLEVLHPQVHLEAQIEKIEEEALKSAKQALKREKLPFSDNIIRTASNDIKKKVRVVREKAINDVRSKYDKEALWKASVRKHEKQKQRRAKILQFLKSIEFVVLEEAHEISGNGYYEILGHCNNAYYRLALTATPFLKDSQEANMRLMARTGPVGIKVTERELIDKGILARPYFRYITLPKAERVFRGTNWQRAQRFGIVENLQRNKYIIKECLIAKKYDLPIMTLVTQKAHGKWLEAALNKVGVKAKFIFGDHEQKERAAALEDLKTKKIDALIGSTILDVGVDVPAVGLVILAGGGKAEVSLRQRVGRGLRAKKEMPNICFIIDFMDLSNNHLKKHSQMRLQVIKDTDGFKQGILSSNRFDYELFGLKKRA